MPTPPAPKAPVSKPIAARAAMGAAVVLALTFAVLPTLLDPDAAVVATEWFKGTDTYMRMVRVREWLDMGAWYWTASPRSNWPYGEVLHWTRPLDVVLVALALPWWPFIGLHKALYVAGTIVGPVTLLAAIAVMLWGMRPVLDARGRVIMVILLGLQPMAQHAFTLSRPDHHGLILLAFTTVLAALTRFAADPARHPRAPLIAGAAAALGIWVSVEGLVTELFALGVLGLAWVVTGRVAWLTALKRFTVAGALVMAAALALERPPDAWLTSEVYDRLSTVHVVVLALIALGVEALHRIQARRDARGRATGAWRRLFDAALAACAAALVMAGLYPAFFKGPFGAAMDPRLADLWLGRVNEFQPLMAGPDSSAALAVIVVGPVLWVVPWVVLWARRARARAPFGPHTGAVVFTLAGTALLFAPLAFLQARWGGYLGVAVVTPWAALLVQALDWHGGPRLGADGPPLLRVPLVTLIALAHVLVAWGAHAWAAEPVKLDPTDCRWRELAPLLTDDAVMGPGPQVVVSFIHMGPEILYRTRHRVVGTPYHRNTRGLLDTLDLFTGTDMARARRILAAREADYVVACVDSHEERFLLETEGETLIRRIHDGRPPAWLAPVALPPALEDAFRIYRVRPDVAK